MDGFDFLWLALRVLSEEAFGPPTVADDFTGQLRQLPSSSVEPTIQLAASQVIGGVSTMTVSEIYNACDA